MAAHHCRVVQTRPGEGEIILATGTQADGDDSVDLHLFFPTERDVVMARTVLEATCASIATNTTFPTELVWDD
jgi:hypothetical protein